jgi:hypothetical protein
MPSQPHPKPPDPTRHPARPRRAARRPVVQPDLFGGPPRVSYRPFDARRLAGIAVGVWKASKPVEGTLGAKFFLTRRMAVPTDATVVRFHPALSFEGTRAPGLVFLLRDECTNAPTGVVRIFIDEYGWPTGRKILGRRDGASISRAPRPP